MREFLKLLCIRFTVSFKNFIEWIYVAFRYYSDISFCKQDLFLLMQYSLLSPYTISKQFLKMKGEADLYTYGETPLTTLDWITKQCGVTKEDTVIELGCGRGRSCFWLHQIIGCRVKGVDYISFFIEKANKVKKRYRLEGIEFQCADFLETTLEEATVIYLYGTCLQEEAIAALVKKCKELPRGTKIITVSYPLTDETEEVNFEVIRRFSAKFDWGLADVFLHIVT